MHYIMSDIHNNNEKFCQMLEKIKFSKEDHLYLLGDLFDRGGDSADPIGVYFQVLKLGDRCSVIRGNHDTWLAQYIKYFFEMPDWMKGIIEDYPYNSFYLMRKRITEVDMQEFAAWILSLPLQVQVDIGEEKYLLAHAMTSHPSEKNSEDYYLVGEELDTWYLKDGIDGYISITGHLSTQNRKIWKNERGNIYRCDCGCGLRTGKLACICLETKEEFYV